jgi:hypothetical protein
VTTNRIKSIKGLFKYALPQTREVTAKGIDISMIDHVQKGQMTKRFLLAKKISQDSIVNDLLDEESTSLSIVYRVCSDDSLLDGLGRENKRWETLDLVVPSPKDYGNLLTALQDLLNTYREERKTYERSVLALQFQWVDMGKDLKENMSINEFASLCDRFNVPLKKPQLATLYKGMHKDLDVEDEGLPLWCIAELMNDVKFYSMEAMGVRRINQDPMLRLFYEIMGTDPVPSLKISQNTKPSASNLELKVNDSEHDKTLSSVAFLSFIRSQQKEYQTSLETALGLLNVLNSQTSSKELAGEQPADDAALSSRDRLSKARFFSYLLSDTNDLFDPSRGRVGADDMTHPLSHYWINSSHDTYLNNWSRKNNGVNGQPDEQMYLAALCRGVRCLEMDIWDGLDGEPIVARNKPKVEEDPCLCITIVLKAVRQFLLAQPKSFPVILNIENHCSYPVQERLATILFDILGSIGLIVVPDDSDSMDESDLLPSPASMAGKVLVMGKRPKVIKEGAKILNDDFDDENDEFHDNVLPNSKTKEEDIQMDDGIVIGFDATGPVRSLDPSMAHNMVRHTPGELLYMAQQEAEQAKMEAAQAELGALAVAEDAEKAEIVADQMIAGTALTKDEVIELATTTKTVELDPVEHVELFNRADGEGVEIQEFFGDAVEGARTSYSEADAAAIVAAEQATISLQALNNATEKLRLAEKVLEESCRREKKVVETYQRASGDARNKAEYAETASRRVERVRELLDECQDNSASADNVVITAMTEAKISEKRAAETESRAARAASVAKKERARADEETRKEEELEREAAKLHDEVVAATTKAQESKERVARASAMLERANEQIKLVEQSNQYQKEKGYLPDHVHEEKTDTRARTAPPDGGSAMENLASKIEERQMCQDLIKKATAEISAAERCIQDVTDAFETKAHFWKKQADTAAHARKVADRSSHTAEEFAEHAEEEREAANLRHVAREKAQANVAEKDSSKSSLKEQLAEAERAAHDADRIAVEARLEAERLSRASSVPQASSQMEGHEVVVEEYERLKAERDEVAEVYEEKREIKKETDERAEETKRRYDSSNEVFTAAMRNAANEMTRANVQKLADRNAIIAFNRARLARKQADHALEVARLAQSVVHEKLGAIKRATEYKEKTDRISEIPVALAKMTFLHTTRHQFWGKSLKMPSTHTHSFSQRVLDEMTKKGPQHPKKIKKFTATHICRTFPSWKEIGPKDKLNVDPIFQWALGCQLVSLNYSTFDEHVLKADGRFRVNGSSGYVLKPDFLTTHPEMIERQQKWTINVLCGSGLPAPESLSRKGNSGGMSYMNPFVRISVYEGGGGHRKTTEHQTRTVKKNGFYPVWDDKADCNFTVASPSMSIIVFTVWNRSENGSEEIIGGSALPVSCIREGYRSVALFDVNHTRTGAYAYASLFVRAQKNAS